MPAVAVRDPVLEAFVAESPIHRRPIADAVARFAAALAPGSAVLDAGAGEAPYRRLFAHCTYTTQDWPSSPHEGAGSADVIADLRALPVPDASYDAVVCTEVLEHVDTPWDAVAEIRRVVRPGGTVLVTVPFVGELHEEPHDHYRYTSHGIAGLFERGGFVVEGVTPLTGYFQTVTHLLRIGGTAFLDRSSRPGPVDRAIAFALLVLSKLLELPARRLDALDRRRALPIGWAVVARAGGADARETSGT